MQAAAASQEMFRCTTSLPDESGAPRLCELVQRGPVDKARPKPKPRAGAVQQHRIEALRREAPAATPDFVLSDGKFTGACCVADGAQPCFWNWCRAVCT